MNHLTLGVYPNGDYKYNVVTDEDLEDHINYNTTFRPGRLLYVDSKRVYDGFVNSESLEEYNKIAEEFFKNNKVNMSKPTIPYR